MSSNLQSRAKGLLPFKSQEYEDFLKEYFPEELKAARRRMATRLEREMAQEQAKALLASNASVRVMSDFHSPVTVRRHPTICLIPEFTEGTGDEAEDDGGERVISVPPYTVRIARRFAQPEDAAAAEGRRLPQDDMKVPMSAAAKLEAARNAPTPRPYKMPSRLPLPGAAGLAQITGQQPIVGADGGMMAVKAPTGQMVFYKSVKNSEMVFPPGTKRITLEMQEKERLEARAKADAEHWKSLPIYKKIGALVSEGLSFKGRASTNTTTMSSSVDRRDDQKAPEARHAKSVIMKHKARAADLRDDISVRAQQAKTKLKTARSDLEKKFTDMTSMVQKKALDMKSKASDLKTQTFASAKNTVASINQKANSQIEDVATRSRNYWKNANQFLKKAITKTTSSSEVEDDSDSDEGEIFNGGRPSSPLSPEAHRDVMSLLKL